MKTQHMPDTTLEVSRIALGCMRLAVERYDPMRTIQAALDQGINMFDHADIYGRGKSEEVFSRIWSEVPGLRQKIVLQSKCGIRFADDPYEGAPHRFDFSYRHIIESVDGILSRLKTDYLDILLLHRPDPLVEPEEVARAFEELHKNGWVRYFGVSNHTGPQIDLLKKYIQQPLVANQLELSLVHLHLLEEGIVANQSFPERPVRGEGMLEYCRLHDITVQSWSPLAGGRLRGEKAATDERTVALNKLVDEMAQEKGVSPEAILIAWQLRHPAHIQPIVGTMNPERIAGCCQADELELTREEWYRLFTAGRGVPLP